MPHIRKQIRDQAVLALTGLATTGANVYGSRVWAVQQTELPCLLVYTLSDQVDASLTTMGGELTRLVQITVEARAKATAVLDDLLDQIEAEVLAAIYAHAGLQALINRLDFEGTTTKFDQADQPHGRTLLSFQAWYQHQEADATTAI